MIYSIGKFLRQLQKARGLTLAELASMLGYKSSTSLVRIMQQRANRESLYKLADRLRTHDQMLLTDQEERQLDDILEADHMRKDIDYAAFVRLRSLLQGEKMPQRNVILTIAEGGAQTTLFRRYGECQRWRGFLINSERAPIFHVLSQMLQKDNFRLEHAMFFNSDQEHTVRLICALLPLMFSTNYEGYAYNLDAKTETMTTGLLRADLLVCDYVTRSGETRHDLIVFNENDAASVIESKHSISTFESLLPPRSSFRSLRSIWYTATGDYLAYCRYCLMLEKDRAIFRIKQDVGMDQIPVPLLRKAVVEGPLYGNQISPALLNSLEEIFHERWQQTLHNANPIHHVMKRSAMWQFAHTGRMSDHFWACRAFTLQERAEILQAMIHLMQSCPDYHFYFLKADDDLLDDEFILYDGAGICVLKPGTNYHLDGHHVETMIVQDEFQAIFKKFFLESIIGFHTFSQRETTALLEQMRQWCLSETQG